jgi:hypothetical protein
MGGFSRALVRGAWHVGQGHGGIVARGGESDEAIEDRVVGRSPEKPPPRRLTYPLLDHTMVLGNAKKTSVAREYVFVGPPVAYQGWQSRSSILLSDRGLV